ncbi:MAG: hypothetical protein K0B14_01555 [Anaerolineaceae bacterium]|nr:hypothetical protein [Anaerolineaceae bacterium]
MQRISEYFYSKATFWAFILSTALFIIFMMLVLPSEATRSDQVIGSAPSPDTSFYYTKAKLYQMAEAYGQEGRLYYLDSRISFDIVWPLVYTLFLINVISWILNKTILEESKLRLLNLAPLAGILLDYLENITNMIIMFRFPQQTDILASLAGVITSLKWVFVGGSFLILVFGIVLWVGVKTNIIKT